MKLRERKIRSAHRLARLHAGRLQEVTLARPLRPAHPRRPGDFTASKTREVLRGLRIARGQERGEHRAIWNTHAERELTHA